jgi:hypothetical protein
MFQRCICDAVRRQTVHQLRSKCPIASKFGNIASLTASKSTSILNSIPIRSLATQTYTIPSPEPESESKKEDEKDDKSQPKQINSLHVLELRSVYRQMLRYSKHMPTHSKSQIQQSIKQQFTDLKQSDSLFFTDPIACLLQLRGRLSFLRMQVPLLYRRAERTAVAGLFDSVTHNVKDNSDMPPRPPPELNPELIPPPKTLVGKERLERRRAYKQALAQVEMNMTPKERELQEIHKQQLEEKQSEINIQKVQQDALRANPQIAASITRVESTVSGQRFIAEPENERDNFFTGKQRYIINQYGDIQHEYGGAAAQTRPGDDQQSLSWSSANSTIGGRPLNKSQALQDADIRRHYALQERMQFKGPFWKGKPKH